MEWNNGRGMIYLGNEMKCMFRNFRSMQGNNLIASVHKFSTIRPVRNSYRGSLVSVPPTRKFKRFHP